jgi:hypothetical protein
MDLSLLSREDCKELGFSIGERNRVAEWAARAVRSESHFTPAACESPVEARKRNESLHLSDYTVN